MLKKLNSYDHELSLRWAICARFNSPYLYLRKYVFALEFSGSGYLWIPYSVIMIALYYTSVKYAMRYILLFTGLMFDIAIVGTTKGLTHRSRPVVNHDDVLSFGPDKYSFPSGHTSFFKHIPAPIIVIWLSSVVASRILLGRHYISDVIAGVLFGIFECSVILHITPLITQFVFSIFGVPH
jgi:membrane-associated phospholipid phosphatase